MPYPATTAPQPPRAPDTPTPAEVAELRARITRRGADRLTPEQLTRAADLAADLLATFARHGIPARVVDNVTSVTAAAVDAVWLQAATR